ncbi:MAG: pyruvate dehydrogenase (acetyl-transferring), homodimeric type [Fidelibacterota bacterium]
MMDGNLGSEDSNQPVAADSDTQETEEWIESLDDIVHHKGLGRGHFILHRLIERAHELGIRLPFNANTPYVNTIPLSGQPSYPGDRQLERRIKSINRWNATALVVRANRMVEGIGGHISTFQSAATLYQVGFNHFFRASSGELGGDQIYFQGHASPGIYAQAFLERRLSITQMENFRRELENGGGLSSYPHPWLMPDFWEFPTVSMGLSPIMGIYQARFNHYLRDRGIKDTEGTRVWAFLGDGELDEPEALGAITLASREKLNNLIFVVNCNLQRLDGPVRGNGKIIQELETVFRGAGWNVIKVIWGEDWDPLIERDTTGLLVQRMNEAVDGDYQKYVVEPGAYFREHFFGKYPELLELVKDIPDDKLKRLRRGGHDPEKVYAGYARAVETEDRPTVILAKTIKGYGLGEAGEGKNITHQQKKLNEEELRLFRDRFEIPVTDEGIKEAPFYRPPEDSEEVQYLLERRRALGGFVPERKILVNGVDVPGSKLFEPFHKGGDRDVSTTMAFVRMLSMMLKDESIGSRIVPIVPDEARTFGMESLFRQVGIYSHAGQVYEPVDADMFLYYREATDGQILEEGITEAGSMSSFIAAGTSHTAHGVDMIPFLIFYSMFGFQRIGDLIWASADMRSRGFLLGATSGRTALNGEGLQHADGHSHLLATTIPNLITYDPAFAYEIAVIIQDGLKRMYSDREDIFVYITLANENYAMPSMSGGVEEGILKGLYRFKKGPRKLSHKAHVLASGPLVMEALRAQEHLAERYDVSLDVWSATSYKTLRQDALDCERWNLLHPGSRPKRPFLTRLFEKETGPVVAVSDYMKLVPDQVARWVPGGLFSLGTDGFGRSDSRPALRRFFEVDAETICLAVLHQLARRGDLDSKGVVQALKDLNIDPSKPNPITA